MYVKRWIVTTRAFEELFGNLRWPVLQWLCIPAALEPVGVLLLGVFYTSLVMGNQNWPWERHC
jgi:hypothetical protein